MSEATPRSILTTDALATRTGTEASLRRLEATLDAMAKRNEPINVSAAARCANVSRTFLYENPQARALVRAAMEHAVVHVPQDCPVHGRLLAIWQARALKAESAVNALRERAESQ